MAAVSLVDVVTEIDGVRILDGVSFQAAEGEFVALVGSSGAGKTSIIRAIRGVRRGRARHGEVRSGRRDRPGDSDRDIGLVVQGDTLFPTHRVRENLSFPLRRRGRDRHDVRKRVEAESRAMGIDHIMERWPKTLSAGEGRLASIARALVRRPRVFLMDEPLTNLDPPTRRRLQRELVSIQRGYGVTTIYVATRADEVMHMPERLVVVDRGRIVQTGTPIEVRDAPATLAVAHLTGRLGLLQGTVERDGLGVVIAGPGFRLRAGAADFGADVSGTPVTVAARPEDVLARPGGPVSAAVGGYSYDAASQARELNSPAGTLYSEDPRLVEGDFVELDLERWHVYDGDGLVLHTEVG